MLYRHTIALLLLAIAAGACSQPQEGVTPETSAPSDTDTDVLAGEATSSVPEDTTISEAEVPRSTVVPSTILSYRLVEPLVEVVPSVPVVTELPEAEVPPAAVLLAAEPLDIGGVAMFAPDLTAEAAELLDVAVDACSGAAVDPFESGCAGAVWELCYGIESDIEKIRKALGEKWDVLTGDQYTAFHYIHNTLCSAAFTAEIVELASVLAASYGRRYYRENRSIVDEERWINDYGEFGGPTRFRGDLRDFADFRHYIEEGIWTFASEITPDLGEEYALVEYVSEAAYAVIKPLLKVLGRNVRYYSLRYSSAPPAEFEAGVVIRSAQEKERISEGAGISIGWLPSSPEDIGILCYDAVYAARINRNGWRDDIESCMVAAEGCAEIQGDQSERCGGILIVAREARLELMWQLLPAICASSEDIIYYNPDDTCRRAAFDAYVYSGASLRSELLYYDDTKNINIREAVFYLSQPLILSNLPQHQRINDARYLEEE